MRMYSLCIKRNMLLWIILASSVVLCMGQGTTASENIQPTTASPSVFYTSPVLSTSSSTDNDFTYLTPTTPDHAGSDETSSNLSFETIVDATSNPMPTSPLPDINSVVTNATPHIDNSVLTIPSNSSPLLSTLTTPTHLGTTSNLMSTSEMGFGESTTISPQTESTNLVMPTTSLIITTQARVTEDATVSVDSQSATDSFSGFQDSSSLSSINFTLMVNESDLANTTAPLVLPTPVTSPPLVAPTTTEALNETINYTTSVQIPTTTNSISVVSPNAHTTNPILPTLSPMVTAQTTGTEGFQDSSSLSSINFTSMVNESDVANTTAPLVLPTPVTSSPLVPPTTTEASNKTINYTTSVQIPTTTNSISVVPPNAHTTNPILPTLLSMVTAQTTGTEDETVTADALTSTTGVSSLSNVLQFSFTINDTSENVTSPDFQEKVAQALANTYNIVSVTNQTRKKREVSASSGQFNVTVLKTSLGQNQTVSADYTVQKNGVDLPGSEAENIIQNATETLVKELKNNNVAVVKITQAPLSGDESTTLANSVENTTNSMDGITEDGVVTFISDYDDTTMPDVTATVITPTGNPVFVVTDTGSSDATLTSTTAVSSLSNVLQFSFTISNKSEDITSLDFQERVAQALADTYDNVSETNQTRKKREVSASSGQFNVTVLNTSLAPRNQEVSADYTVQKNGADLSGSEAETIIQNSTETLFEKLKNNSVAVLIITQAPKVLRSGDESTTLAGSVENTTNSTDGITEDGVVTFISNNTSSDTTMLDVTATVITPTENPFFVVTVTESSDATTDSDSTNYNTTTMETATAITTAQTTVEVNTIQYDSSNVVTFRFIHNATNMSDSIIAEVLAVTLDTAISSANMSTRRRRDVSASTGNVTVTVINSNYIHDTINGREVETDFIAASNGLLLPPSTVVRYLEQSTETIQNFASQGVHVSRIIWNYLIYYVFNIYGSVNYVYLFNEMPEVLSVVFFEAIEERNMSANVSSVVEITTGQYEATFTVRNIEGTYDNSIVNELNSSLGPELNFSLIDEFWPADINVMSINISTTPIARASTAATEVSVTDLTSVSDTTETAAEIDGAFPWYYIVIIILGIICLILLIVICVLCCLRWWNDDDDDGIVEKPSPRPVDETPRPTPQFQPVVHPPTPTPPPVVVINETPPFRHQERPRTPVDDEPDATPTPPSPDLSLIMPNCQPLVLSPPPSMKMSQETFSPKFRSTIHPIVLPPINAVVSRDVGGSLSDEAMMRQKRDMERHKSKVKLRKRHPRRFGPYEDAQSEIDQVLRPSTPTIIRGPRRLRRGRDSITLDRDEDPDISMMLGRRRDYPGIYSRNIDSPPSTDSGVASPETIRRKMQSLLDDAFSLLTPSANRNLVGPVPPIQVQPPMVTPGPHPLMHHPDGRTSTPHHREFTPVGSSERTTPNDAFFARGHPQVPNVFQVPHDRMGSPAWGNTNYNNSNGVAPMSSTGDSFGGRNIPPPNGFQSGTQLSDPQTGETQNSASILQSIKDELSRMAGTSTPVKDLSQTTIKKED